MVPFCRITLYTANSSRYSLSNKWYLIHVLINNINYGSLLKRYILLVSTKFPSVSSLKNSLTRTGRGEGEGEEEEEGLVVLQPKRICTRKLFWYFGLGTTLFSFLFFAS